MVFIQESKLEEVNPRVWRFLTGHGQFSGEFVSSVRAAGGLITLWNEKFFSLEQKIVANRFLLVVGIIGSRNLRCGFGNIYAPNDDTERQAFWAELGSVIKNFDIPWCLGVISMQSRSEERRVGKEC